MEKRSAARNSSLALCILLSAFGSSGLGAQSDTSEVARATLHGWEEQVRLAILDRGGSFFGRTSERGILQRFNEAMDSEYDLDVISSFFTLSEVYEWYRRDSGARYWGGSIDHLRLVHGGDIKARVSLGETWAARVQFTVDESLRTQRSLIRLAFQKELAEGRSRFFALGTLTALKPETDIELGYTWSPRAGVITVALAALDLFSDVVYTGLGVDPGVADTALDHASQPFTVRAALDLSLAPKWRVEAYGLHLTPTSVTVESQTQAGDGFSQDERYDYAGGQLEFEPFARTALGTFVTWVRASLDREPLPSGPPEDAFALTEATTQLGLYAIHRFEGPLALEGWAARVWRTEERSRPDTTAAPAVDYEDRTWMGRLSLMYRAAGGFRAEPGIDFTLRESSGKQPVETLAPLDRNNVRLRLDIGWGFARRAYFYAGANVDLDVVRFDGAHGRFALYF